MNLRTTLRLRFVPFNSIIHLERKPRGTISATKERIQVSILMELRNPWTFGSIASIKRILWKTESLFHLSIRCFENNFSPFFPLHDVSMFRLSLARFTRGRNSYFASVCRSNARTYVHNGKRRFNASLANNRVESRQSRDFTLLFPIRESGRIREEFDDHRRAYLSDKGQARILKDASTVTTSSMIPNVMYITPRCTRENR